MRPTFLCAACSGTSRLMSRFRRRGAATDAAAAKRRPRPTPRRSASSTPEEKAEKEARKECKKKICDILATRDPNGDDVACDITKTWREEDIVKMLGGKISWPWGKAVCQSGSRSSASRSPWR